MNCPFCAAENGTKANYCSSCGSPLHLRVCPHCEGVNEKTATACISCGGALVAEPELPAGPAVATHIPARLGVMDDNVIDLEATGFTWANNGRRDSAWPKNIRPENIWQQNNQRTSSADLERLLRNIDEEIHRLDPTARPVPAVAPRAALRMPGPSEEPMAAAHEPVFLHPSLAANGGGVEMQQSRWTEPVLLLVSAAIGIAAYLSLPPEPSSMLAGSVAADKRIGGGSAAAPPASEAMTAKALASPPAKFDKPIAAIPAVVPKAGANSPARPDDPQADPLGELIAAKLQTEPPPPETSAAPRPTKAGNGLEAPSVPDTDNALASQARLGAITAVSDISVRAGSGQPKPIRASSKSSQRNAMLRASQRAELESVKRHLY